MGGLIQPQQRPAQASDQPEPAPRGPFGPGGPFARSPGQATVGFVVKPRRQSVAHISVLLGIIFALAGYGLHLQGLGSAVRERRRGRRRRLHRHPRRAARHAPHDGHRLGAGRPAHRQRLLAAALALAAVRHRRLGGRGDRHPGHLPGRHAVADREPQPAGQGDSLHRLQHRRDPCGLQPRQDQPDPVPAQRRLEPGQARRRSRHRRQHPICGTRAPCSRATPSCSSCAPTTGSPR